MKKILLCLMLSSPCLAGTITTTSTGLMTVTFSSGTVGAVGGGTTYTYTQKTDAAAGTYTVNMVLGTNVTVHSLIVVGCQILTANNTMTVTDNNTNSYTAVTGATYVNQNGGGSNRIGLWYTLNANAGATTVTCADSGHTATAVQGTAVEYTTASGGTYDTGNYNSPVSAGSPSGAATTTTVTNEFVVDYASNMGGTVTSQSGTLRSNYVNQFYSGEEDTTVATPQSYSGTFTAASGGYVMVQAAFK